MIYSIAELERLGSEEFNRRHDELMAKLDRMAAIEKAKKDRQKVVNVKWSIPDNYEGRV